MKNKDKKTRKRYFKSRKNKPIVTDEMRIYISPVMFVMALYFVAIGMSFEFVCSLAAVLLHECAHARVARRFGYELNIIKLMPYGAALCGNIELRPKHETVIAIAGPLFNLVTAALLAALWWLVPQSYVFTQAFCAANLYIGLFNLIPVYPLDGGRIALAVLTARLGRACANKIMRILSAVFGIAALVLFGISAVYTPNLCLLSVGLFMLISAFIPDKKAGYTALYAQANRLERLKTPLEVRSFAVSEKTPATDMLKNLDPSVFCEFTVMNADLDVVGRISETELIETIKTRGYGLSASDTVLRNKK